MVTSFPLVSFFITLLLVFTLGGSVIDTEFNPVRSGRKYFIQPVKTASNNGGGLVPAAISVLPFCPLGITQTLLPYQPGLPVSFSYLERIAFVTQSIKVSIEFQSDIWPVCNEFSKVWRVDDSSSASSEPSIIIGGELGKPNYQFRIERAGAGPNTYKLTALNRTVGATPGVWLKAPQLILTDDDSKTLLVKFKKVDDVTTTTTSTSRLEKLSLRMFPFY